MKMPWSSVSVLVALVAVFIVAGRMYIYRVTVPERLFQSPDQLRGKVVLITGATAGLGLGAAKALHKMGAHVIIGARDAKKVAEVMKEIRAERKSNPPPLEWIPLDLADLSSVREFVAEFKKKNLPLHYLINNAGAFFVKNDVTKDGFERCWQINTLSHFLITTSLLDEINKYKTRVINTSSYGHSLVENYKPLTMEDVRSNMNETYGKIHMGAYYVSKLSGVHFYSELLRRVDKGVIVVGANPGFVRTDLPREAPGYASWLIALFQYLWGKSPLEGAYTTLHLVLADEKDIVNGGYYENSALAKASPDAENVEYQRKLWELCEECVKKY